ncbi:MAG: response regulator transcription factor [Spirochaetaceae bacterium]|nr:response regulator transcription factor [Spirochaetaceae bacterium]
MYKVLIIDDEKAIVKLLERVMKNEGFITEAAYDGATGLEKALNNTYSIIFLDINMPKMDGFQLLEKLREEGNDTPIIIISGNLDDYAALYGLEIGADNFITKPFNPKIVAAKAKSLLKVVESEKNSEILVQDPFTFNPDTMVVTKDGIKLNFSAKEVLMMKLFLENIDRVFSKETLYNQIWGNISVDKNSIMVYINHLRNKIEENPKRPKFLKTIWGTGYSFTVPKN